MSIGGIMGYWVEAGRASFSTTAFVQHGYLTEKQQLNSSLTETQPRLFNRKTAA
jgi:hypothetical protein